MTDNRTLNRRQFLGAAGATLLAASVDISSGARAATGTTPGRILIVRSSTSEAIRIDEALIAGLTGAGHNVAGITYEDVTNGQTIAGADLIVVSDAPRLPVDANSALVGFSKQGGCLALLGGPTSSDPMLHVGEGWLSAKQCRDTMLATPLDQTLLSTPTTGSGNWSRNTANKASASCVNVDPAGPAGPNWRFDLRQVLAWKWDFFTTAVQAPATTECNLIGFWAKGDRATPKCSIEIRVAGQGIWRHSIDLDQEWKQYVLPTAEFHPDRNSDEHMALDKAASISFGVSTCGDAFSSCDHTFWISQIKAGHYAKELPPTAASPFEFSLLPSGDMIKLDDIRALAPSRDQDIAGARHAWTGKVSGISAVGIEIPGQSSYLPLLDARDKYGRAAGCALGLTINYSGPYKGSTWLLAGIDSPQYYESPRFLDLLNAAAASMCSGALLARANAKAKEAGRFAISLTTPAQSFVRLDKEHARFIGPTRAPLFFTGVNYLGLNWQLREEDFQRARDAGINFFRLWAGTDGLNPVMTDSIRECARRYGIYLLIHIGGLNRDGDSMAQRTAKIASVWRDEPMVLGYDLLNEPEITNIGAVEYGGKPSPILQITPYERYASNLDLKAIDSAAISRTQWPPLAKWASEDQAKQLYAANQLWHRFGSVYTNAGASETTEPGISAPLDFAGEFADALAAIDESFGLWIRSQRDAIRANDPNHFITVGYNTLYSCLPCNRDLDFISHHAYEAPVSLGAQRLNSTVLDRLAKVWPQQPATLGEFGYSNGVLIDGKPVDIHASAVGEMIVYLTALAHGHSGCAKWMLNDIPGPVYAATSPYISPSSYASEGAFGLFAYDGTSGGRAKPIVHALRSLREYLDAGGQAGQIETFESEGQVGYVFKSKHGIFAGGIKGNVEGLTFRSASNYPVNVALYRANNKMRLRSDSDAIVELGHTITLLAGDAVTIG